MREGVFYLNPRKNSEMTKLDKLHKRATSVLFRCKTVFPFDFFPNTLIIDQNKVDIIYSNFFLTHQTVSIPVPHLNYVRVETSILFSTLKIEVKGMQQNPQPLRFLWKKDAKKAQHLLFGLMSAHSSKIDLTNFKKHEILDKLIEIGAAS